MTILLSVVIALLAILLIVAGLIVRLLHQVRTESGAALRALQLQIAFIAGRIGLRNRDLEAQIPLSPEPEGSTDAENFTEWNEADWLIAQAEENADVAGVPGAVRNE